MPMVTDSSSRVFRHMMDAGCYKETAEEETAGQNLAEDEYADTLPQADCGKSARRYEDAVPQGFGGEACKQWDCDRKSQ